MSVVEALAEVMSEVQAVAKTDRNDHQKFNFRGIDAVLNAVGPALRRHGVVVVPVLEDVAYEAVTTSTGKGSTACRVIVTYRFHHGETTLECRVAAEAWDHGDKATPKAMSVAFRTALLQALALPTDEPDPDASSYERAAVDPRTVAARDADLNDLLARASDLVDTEQVLEFASRGPSELEAAKERLRQKLAAAP